MSAFEENESKKVRTAEDGDESAFVAESGKPSPGQLTADKACSLLISQVHVFYLFCSYFAVSITVRNVKLEFFP